MKRLMLVTTSYPDGDEGEAAAGVFVADFAHALAETGVEIEVVAPSTVDNCGKEDGVEVTRFAAPRLPLSLLNPLRPTDWQAIATTITRGSRAVRRACEAARPDHILAFWALPSGVWAQQAQRRYDIPYSTWALGSDIWTLGAIPGVRSLLRQVLQGAKLRFADGYGLATDVERISGRPCEFLPSSRRLPHAQHTAVRASGPYRLAYLGRWHPNKGVDLLLDALKMLDEPTWRSIELVRIHGGGPLDHVVRERVAELSAVDRPVEAGGYLDRDGASALLAWADYALIPSRIESIPVVFSDAMQMQRPVIATPVGDLPRLLAHAPPCGVLAQGVAPEDFALAITEALRSGPDHYSPGLREMANHFDVQRSARTYLRLVTDDV